MIVRSDLPIGVQVAQMVHAAGQSAQLRSAMPTAPPTVAVALAGSLDQLLALERALIAADVSYVMIREPDPPWVSDRQSAPVIAVVRGPAGLDCGRRLRDAHTIS